MAARCGITFSDDWRVRYRGMRDGEAAREWSYPLPHAKLLVLTLRWFAHILASSPNDAQQQAFLRVVGLNLFELVFPASADEDARAARRDFIYLTGQGDVVVDLAFEASADLSGLPWEFLYVPAKPDQGFFLADPRKRITLCRRRGAGGLPMSKVPLKVLVLVSAPEGPRADVPSHDLEDFLEQRLAADCDGKLRAVFLPAVTDWDALREAIERDRPDIFHFRGHGERGGLWLAKKPEQVEQTRHRIAEARERGDFSPEIFDAGQLVDTSGVAGLFEKHQPSLVILEACQSAAPPPRLGTGLGFDDAFLENAVLPRIASDLLTKVPAVVAMQYRVRATTASSFVRNLYHGIVEGRPVDEAVRSARAELTKGGGVTTDFTDRAFGAPVYLGSHGPLCDRLLADIVTRCPECGRDYLDWSSSNYQNFCGDCGFRMHYKCRCGTVNAARDRAPERRPVNCRVCGAPLESAVKRLESAVETLESAVEMGGMPTLLAPPQQPAGAP